MFLNRDLIKELLVILPTPQLDVLVKVVDIEDPSHMGDRRVTFVKPTCKDRRRTQTQKIVRTWILGHIVYFVFGGVHNYPPYREGCRRDLTRSLIRSRYQRELSLNSGVTRFYLPSFGWYGKGSKEVYTYWNIREGPSSDPLSGENTIYTP